MNRRQDHPRLYRPHRTQHHARRRSATHFKYRDNAAATWIVTANTFLLASEAVRTAGLFMYSRRKVVMVRPTYFIFITLVVEMVAATM